MKRIGKVGIVRGTRWALGAAAFLCVGAAQAAGKLELENAVFQEVEVETADGRTERRQQPATRVVPGNDVVYVVQYRNVGDGPVENVAITNPVPEQLVFLASSGAVQVDEYSVDGGDTYGALAELTVPGPDGAPRAAQPSDVTHLRWVLPELAAGAGGAVSFTARVR